MASAKFPNNYSLFGEREGARPWMSNRMAEKQFGSAPRHEARLHSELTQNTREQSSQAMGQHVRGAESRKQIFNAQSVQQTRTYIILRVTIAKEALLSWNSTVAPYEIHQLLGGDKNTSDKIVSYGDINFRLIHIFVLFEHGDDYTTKPFNIVLSYYTPRNCW